jgi:D-serine deaminase-like pyridoxal phosphate-dependent protein
MVDHPDQLKHLTSLASKSGNPPLVFLKIDVGGCRAGVVPHSPGCLHLIDRLLVSEAVGSCVFLGVYASAGQPHEARGDWEALDYLGLELRALRSVAWSIRKERPGHPLVLSVGSTPTVTALQHPAFGKSASSSQGGGADNEEDVTAELTSLIAAMKKDDFTLELHAGAYPVLDLQQLATHARDSTFLNSAAIAISVLVEVCSLYPSRGPSTTTEALINAGTLALAREPCTDKVLPPDTDYSSFGIVTPWNCKGQPVPGPAFPAGHGGWQVGKVTQEHGILRWIGEREDEVRLYVGQRLRVWPNHACITGASYGWYLVVDSRKQGRAEEIVDVWPRWSGW